MITHHAQSFNSLPPAAGEQPSQSCRGDSQQERAWGPSESDWLQSLVNSLGWVWKGALMGCAPPNPPHHWGSLSTRKLKIMFGTQNPCDNSNHVKMVRQKSISLHHCLPIECPAFTKRRGPRQGVLSMQPWRNKMDSLNVKSSGAD